MTDQQPDPDDTPGTPDPDENEPLGNNEDDPEGGDPDKSQPNDVGQE